MGGRRSAIRHEHPNPKIYRPNTGARLSVYRTLDRNQCESSVSSWVAKIGKTLIENSPFGQHIKLIDHRNIGVVLLSSYKIHEIGEKSPLISRADQYMLQGIIIENLPQSCKKPLRNVAVDPNKLIVVGGPLAKRPLYLAIALAESPLERESYLALDFLNRLAVTHVDNPPIRSHVSLVMFPSDAPVQEAIDAILPLIPDTLDFNAVQPQKLVQTAMSN